jgi:hypothetical protein
MVFRWAVRSAIRSSTPAGHQIMAAVQTRNQVVTIDP